ncbi:MAG: OmpA family protein [Bacteroidota bacterium]
MNKSKIVKGLFYSALASIVIISCVPARKLEEEQGKRTSCETELKALKETNQKNETLLAEYKSKMAEIEKQIYGLQKDTSITGTNYRNLTQKYDKLNQVNEQLLSQLSKLSQNAANQNTQLVGQLQMTQEQLIKKEDELKKLQLELDLKKKSLDELTAELDKRQKKIQELEDILKKKDESIKELKKKVSDALIGFEGNGLTVTQKNGKIYVSMDESLLFATGSTTVQSKGVEALKKLAKLLETNADINIMVEGHTDDQPMNGSGEIKDNWDLSVMRATSVTKILLKGTSIDPKRITAAGRGEFYPVDMAKTPEARKKNRRTEIILTPKLDELLKVLDSN